MIRNRKIWHWKKWLASLLSSSDIEALHNANICKQKAKMVIYESANVYNSLYRPLLEEEQNLALTPSGQPNQFRNGPQNPFSNLVLSGFFIEPTTEDANQQITNLRFSPALLKNQQQSYQEYNKTLPSLLPIAESSSLPVVSANVQADVVAQVLNSSSPSFDHTQLQFYSVNDFDKAFISSYELYLLCENSTYLGIVGAKVSTGNFLSLEERQGVLSLTDCNKDFFTYRFIGFNEYELSETEMSSIDHPENYLFLDRANKSSKPLLFARMDEGSQLTNPLATYSHTIPAETWAVPCPPVWIPQ